ncbi:MAG: DUF2510 domain-containing protein [Vicinamibacterales bacterium]
MTEPGWYPDPLGGQGARYWDGIRWDGAVQPGLPPASIQEYPEPPPTTEKPRRLWPVWVGLGVTVAIAIGSAAITLTRPAGDAPESAPSAAPASTPTTAAASPTLSTEDIADSVQVSMQRKFDDDPDLREFRLKVVDVVLVHKAGNEFKGIATVQTSDGVEHDVPVDVTADDENTLWEAEPGAFAFVQDVRPALPPRPVIPPPNPMENFKLCPSGLSGVASADTSCAFADSVRAAWYAHPGPAVMAYSPVTKQSNLMRCVPAVTDAWPESKRCTGTNAQGTVLVVYID